MPLFLREFVRGCTSAVQAPQLISALGLWRRCMRIMALHLGFLVVLWLPLAAGSYALLQGLAEYFGGGAALSWVALLAFGLVSAAVAFGGVVLLAQAVAMPLLEGLSATVESRLGATRPASPPLGVGAALRLGFGDALGAAGLALVLFPVQLVLALLVPGVGWLLGCAATALILAQELMTLPLALRGVGYRARWRWIGARLPAALGFGLSVEVMLLLPVTVVFVLPVACVGGTWLFCQLDSAAPGARP